MTDGNIFGSFFKVFVFFFNLQGSLVIFWNFQKIMLRNSHVGFGQFFENLWKSSGSSRKCLENCQKCCYQYIYTLNKIMHSCLKINYGISLHFILTYLMCSLVRYCTDCSKTYRYSISTCMHTDVLLSSPYCLIKTSHSNMRQYKGKFI